MPPIGDTLREARMRQRLDIVDVEERTKIRAKYLRALENEEWALLPGPTFVRTFLRTYAEAVGLDPHVLVEAYRSQHDDGEEPEAAQQPLAATPRRRSPRGARAPERRRPPGPSGPPGPLAVLGGAVVLVLIGLLVLGLLGGDDDAGPATPERAADRDHAHGHDAEGRAQAEAQARSHRGDRQGRADRAHLRLHGRRRRQPPRSSRASWRRRGRSRTPASCG